MKEFCNFQNCGLSFTLFNKLVWALIMENGCREKARERERMRERKTTNSSQLSFDKGSAQIQRENRRERQAVCAAVLPVLE